VISDIYSWHSDVNDLHVLYVFRDTTVAYFLAKHRRG